MKYPIDEQTFKDLVHTRERMVSLNSKSNCGAIAWPFVPWIGRDILEGSPGIYFIGIATRGPWNRSQNLEQCQKRSEEHAANPDSRPFWRYIKAVTEAVFCRDYAQSTDRIAWSNQFKIGIESGDPYGIYAETQQKLSKSILERELRLADRCVVVFMGTVESVLPKYFDRENDWDCDKYREHGVWLRYNANRAPIFYQYHPQAFARRGIQFGAHVALMAEAIKEYLGNSQLAARA